MFNLLKVIGLGISGLILAGLLPESLYADAAIQNIRLVKEDGATRVDFEELIYNSDTYVYQIVVEWVLANRTSPEIHNLLVARCMPVGQHSLSDKVQGEDVVKVSVYFDPRPENCLGN